MIKATKKRLFLSWFIDFLLFMTLWALLTYLLNIGNSVSFWQPLLAFASIRFVLVKYFGSVGYNFLSIEKNNLSVNENLLTSESRLTMFLGLLLILEGTKQLVRWTQTFVSVPAFGFFPTESTQILAYIVYGIFSVLAGYWFLKLDIRGFVIGIVLSLLNLVSYLLSWHLWDTVIEKMLVKRKEAQGLPLRDGEIETMQLLMPEGMIVFITIILIAIVFTYPRFKKSNQTNGQ